MPRGGEYISLPARNSSEDLLEDSEADRPSRGYSKSALRGGTSHNERLVFWAALGVACSTAFSAALSLLTVFYPPDVAAPSQITTGVPHRPNPYLYLNKILANTTQKFDPITNFPPVALQFDNADPKRRMREEDRGRPTSFGTVYPDDRRILVNDKVSTVVQFRNIDYAMERCVLHTVIPERNGTFDPDVTLADPSMVDVWLLDGPTEFSRYIRGSMEYAPKRRELLTTLTFSRSEPSRSSEFHCTSGEFTTLELTCSPANAGCSVEFWQDQRAKPLGGLYMVQYPTLPLLGARES
ncbi:hypothetical protein C8Q74DRAFT_1359986 [Fomes fomentarius]|nr:hypothetical protein C8Q74DRAFT_1359986 [Fomes fomentarius]